MFRLMLLGRPLKSDDPLDLVERIRRLVPSHQHRTPHRMGTTAGLKRRIFTTRSRHEKSSSRLRQRRRWQSHSDRHDGDVTVPVCQFLAEKSGRPVHAPPILAIVSTSRVAALRECNAAQWTVGRIWSALRRNRWRRHGVFRGREAGSR